MGFCPSQDWDRYCSEQEEANAAELEFLKRCRSEIVQVTCALLASGEVMPDVAEGDVVDLAVKYVRYIDNLCTDPYE